MPLSAGLPVGTRPYTRARHVVWWAFAGGFRPRLLLLRDEFEYAFVSEVSLLVVTGECMVHTTCIDVHGFASVGTRAVRKSSNGYGSRARTRLPPPNTGVHPTLSCTHDVC